MMTICPPSAASSIARAAPLAQPLGLLAYVSTSAAGRLPSYFVGSVAISPAEPRRVVEPAMRASIPAICPAWRRRCSPRWTRHHVGR